MPFKAPQFNMQDVDVKKEETVFKGFFKMVEVTLRHKLFGGGWSNEISREIFYRGNAAAAILYDVKTDCIGLVEQFRIGAMGSDTSPWCLEAVAGMVEDGETCDALILRELREEAGIEDADLIPITRYFSTPGGCNEVISLYCALCDLNGKEGVYGLPEENEDIRLHVLPAQVVFDSMLTGRTNNAATLIALQWLQIHRGNLQQ